MLASDGKYVPNEVARVKILGQIEVEVADVKKVASYIVIRENLDSNIFLGLDTSE